MSADYDVTGMAPAATLPPPPPTSPPPTAPAAAPPPPPSPPAAVATTAKPEVLEINVSVRRVVFIEAGRDQPKGTAEVSVGFRAFPDPAAPASASLDRLWATAKAKLNTYLLEVAP